MAVPARRLPHESLDAVLGRIVSVFELGREGEELAFEASAAAPAEHLRFVSSFGPLAALDQHILVPRAVCKHVRHTKPVDAAEAPLRFAWSLNDRSRHCQRLRRPFFLCTSSTKT